MNTSTLKDNGWELENTELPNSPKKFELPPRVEIENLKVEEIVKLRFLFWENDDSNTQKVTGESM